MPVQQEAAVQSIGHTVQIVAGTTGPGGDLACGKQAAVPRSTASDWRAFERRVNRLPQFLTTIDGLDIHFIHLRSRHPGVLPIVLSHGWPGSFGEPFLGVLAAF